MIIIFNWIGAGIILVAMVIAGGLMAALVKWLGPGAAKVGMIASGVIVIILDLLYRFKRGEGNILHPRRGGHVFFIPVWILGGLWILGSLCGLDDSLATNHAAYARNARDTSSETTRRSYGGGQRPANRPNQASALATTTPAPKPEAKPQTILAESPRTFDGLKVGMISGTPGHRVATINGEPFSEGEAHKLTLPQQKLIVQCLEIRENSVIAKVQGESHPRELQVGQTVSLTTQ